MIRLAVITAAVWLAMVLGGAAQSQTPPPIIVEPPDGVTLHLTQSGIFIDSNGVIFAKTRGPSSRGDIVWKVENGESIIVLEPGPDVAYGNGYLDALGGYCRLVTTTANNEIAAYVIPECVAP